jgi:alginate O-acetyltransferase complex protein AlgI
VTLTYILVFALASLLAGWALPLRWRVWFLLGASVLAAYWLQPSTPIRNLDFWFPTASILLTAVTWAVTRSPQAQPGRRGWIAAIIVVTLIVAVALLRYAGPACCLTPSRPPTLLRVLAVLGIAGLLVAIPLRFPSSRRILVPGAIVLILGLLVVLKSPFVAQQASAWLRIAGGQPALLAAAGDLPWLGYSYLAFRLVHVLRDYQAGKLPAYDFGEFMTYAVFYPTYTAGPIDRSQRFMGDLRGMDQKQPAGLLVAIRDPTRREQLVQGGTRILIGLFKKFVLADGLALIALNSQNASQVRPGLWMWVMLYAYALRIYFDFAGYTDIALGLGRMAGFRLPENFDRPYLKQNLTAFWNSWHITLAMWFRGYYFNPLTRYLRSHTMKIPTWAIILIGQLSTMLLIGLWHGITWNFAAWGAWHGMGLFIHNRWSDWTRPHWGTMDMRPGVQKALAIGGWLITFNYVALGWVFFALPSLRLSLAVFEKLFGY